MRKAVRDLFKCLPEVQPSPCVNKSYNNSNSNGNGNNNNINNGDQRNNPQNLATSLTQKLQ